MEAKEEKEAMGEGRSGSASASSWRKVVERV